LEAAQPEGVGENRVVQGKNNMTNIFNREIGEEDINERGGGLSFFDSPISEGGEEAPRSGDGVLKKVYKSAKRFFGEPIGDGEDERTDIGGEVIDGIKKMAGSLTTAVNGEIGDGKDERINIGENIIDGSRTLVDKTINLINSEIEIEEDQSEKKKPVDIAGNAKKIIVRTGEIAGEVIKAPGKAIGWVGRTIRSIQGFVFDVSAPIIAAVMPEAAPIVGAAVVVKKTAEERGKKQAAVEASRRAAELFQRRQQQIAEQKAAEQPPEEVVAEKTANRVIRTRKKNAN